MPDEEMAAQSLMQVMLMPEPVYLRLSPFAAQVDKAIPKIVSVQNAYR